jgi:hypothetical protein
MFYNSQQDHPDKLGQITAAQLRAAVGADA